MSTLPTASTPIDLAATPVSPSMSPSEPGVRPLRWTREEYHRLGEQGWFRNRRVEVINGEIIQVSPQSSEHRWTILHVSGLLETAFGDGFVVIQQGTVVAADHSEPDPDLSVHVGNNDDYLRQHPTTAVLALEVAKTSQRFDKTTKADLYASAKIEDYWVLDLERRELTVFRKPIEVADSPFGWRYALTEVFTESGAATPLAANAEFKVVDMLPPASAE